MMQEARRQEGEEAKKETKELELAYPRKVESVHAGGNVYIFVTQLCWFIN